MENAEKQVTKEFDDSDFDPNTENGRAMIKELLINVTRRIINDLPESQKQFFSDLFDRNVSQADVAREYGITPQAVTNRITKLKRTVEKKLREDYDLDGEYIKVILKFRTFDQLRSDDMERIHAGG